MALHDPVRRTERLIEESAGDDVVIYDRDTDRVIALDSTDATLWRSCDGTRGVSELAALADLSEAEAAESLARLDDAGLMAKGGISRRAMLTKAGLVGAGVGAVSLASIMAPVAANAASVTPPPAGGGAGVVVHTPIIRFDGGKIDISLKNGIVITPGVIGTGFGPSSQVGLTYSYTNLKGAKTTNTVSAYTTDDGSFYIAGVKLPNISPGATVNFVASTAAGVTSAPLTLLITAVNGLGSGLGKKP